MVGIFPETGTGTDAGDLADIVVQGSEGHIAHSNDNDGDEEFIGGSFSWIRFEYCKYHNIATLDKDIEITLTQT